MTRRQVEIYRVLRDLGYTAQESFRDAKTISAFEKAEREGIVRLGFGAETDCYFDVFGRGCLSKKEDKYIERSINRWGCWTIFSQARIDGVWETVDSVGMCIYRDPLSWIENFYVPDLMRAALKRIEDFEQTQELVAAENWP